jgi:hypothetical protein
VMLTHTPRWSHARGNPVVPSRWQATPGVERSVGTTRRLSVHADGCLLPRPPTAEAPRGRQRPHGRVAHADAAAPWPYPRSGAARRPRQGQATELTAALQCDAVVACESSRVRCWGSSPAGTKVSGDRGEAGDADRDGSRVGGGPRGWPPCVVRFGAPPGQPVVIPRPRGPGGAAEGRRGLTDGASPRDTPFRGYDPLPTRTPRSGLRSRPAARQW